MIEEECLLFKLLSDRTWSLGPRQRLLHPRLDALRAFYGGLPAQAEEVIAKSLAALSQASG